MARGITHWLSILALEKIERPGDPFLGSFLARSAGWRVFGASIVAGGLWLAIAWAVALP